MLNWLPFRYRYWIIQDIWTEVLYVVSSRTNPTWNTTYANLVDGPFDSNDETVRAMTFWDDFLDGTEVSFCDEEDEDWE
jgi:hypothetical protein